MSLRRPLLACLTAFLAFSSVAASVRSQEPVEQAAAIEANDDPFYARFGSAASYLSSLDLDPTGVFANDAPTAANGMLQGGELTFALRALYQLNRFPDERLVEWNRIEGASDAIDLATLAPLAAVHWAGIVERVETFDVPEDLYLEMKQISVLYVRPDPEATWTWRILVASVPEAWKSGAPMTPASGYALFLRTDASGENETDGAMRVWAVGDPPLWRPTEPDQSLGVTPSRVSLAEAGVNLADLDGLRRRDKAEFGAGDKDPFYAFLRASQVVSRERRRELEREVQLTDLLVDPNKYLGEAVRFPARIRRITEIRIEDPEIAKSVGSDRYWQLDLVYELGDQPIRMRGRNGEDLVFKSTFPATACVLELPAAVEEARQTSIARGDGGVVNLRTVVTGYFFRLWAFPTEQTRAAGTDVLQFGPLVIGTIVSSRPVVASPSWFWWFLFPGALLLVALVFYLFRAMRGDSINDQVRNARMRRDAHKLADLPKVAPRPIGPPPAATPSPREDA